MKIVGYESPRGTLIGRLSDDGAVTEIAPIDVFWADPQAAVAGAAKGEAGLLASLTEKPAVPVTSKVVCIGLNYRKHAEESNMPIPTIPVVFNRWASTLAVNGQPVPAMEEKFDWEVELGVVVGRRLFRATPEQALAGVFGYAVVNDLSCRSFQVQTAQWTLGKNSDASAPMSGIVTKDSLPDPADGMRLTTRVNGRTVQDSSTSDLIFTVGQVLSHVSQVITLEPGDLIITGTPSGVGAATGEFLKPGDTVEVEIEGIGVVSTPIVAAPAPIY